VLGLFVKLYLRVLGLTATPDLKVIFIILIITLMKKRKKTNRKKKN
jgi:hypothetical protein